MDTKWVIIWLSLQITGLSILVTKQAYDLGFARGRLAELSNWNQDADGYCLADIPPHPGQCKEDKGDSHASSIVSSKRR